MHSFFHLQVCPPGIPRGCCFENPGIGLLFWITRIGVDNLIAITRAVYKSTKENKEQ